MTSSAPTMDEDDLLPLSGLAHVVFCERRAALHHVEGVWEENLFTVEGAHLHDRVHDGPETESRGDLLIARSLRLRSFSLGVSGIADVVEFRRSDRGAALPGRQGLWAPMPVEYKRGRKREERSYMVQVCAQALCLEEMLGVAVPMAALYYGKSARRAPVTLDDDLRADTRAAAARLHEIVSRRETPPAEPSAKCESCSLVDLCLPSAARRRRGVTEYLRRALAVSEEADP